MNSSHPSLISGCSAAAFVAVLACGIASPPARCDSATCLASKDNTLFQYVYDPDNPTAPIMSNGIGPWFASGQNNSLQIQRALLQFDLSDIPANATITGVTLDLHVTDVPKSETSGGGNQRTFWLKALQLPGGSSWGEGQSNAVPGPGTGRGVPAQPGDATWLHQQYDTVPWPAGREGALGPDRLDASGLGEPAGVVPAMDSVPSTPVPVTWTNAGMALDVQAWVHGDVLNDGWVVVGEEGDSDALRGSKRTFASREAQAYQPTLTVQYTVPPESPATRVWKGAAVDDNSWSNAANWGGTVPQSGSILQFGTAPPANTITQNDLDDGTPFGGVVFAADAPAYRLQGAGIKLAGPIQNLSRNDQVLGLDVEFVAGGGEFDDRGKTLSATHSLRGAGPLVKSGTGTLALSGENDYSGGTVVSGGTLLIADARAVPARGSLTIGNGCAVVLQAGLTTAPANRASLRGVLPVPEPTTLVLLLAGGAALAAGRFALRRAP